MNLHSNNNDKLNNLNETLIQSLLRMNHELKEENRRLNLELDFYQDEINGYAIIKDNLINDKLSLEQQLKLFKEQKDEMRKDIKSLLQSDELNKPMIAKSRLSFTNANNTRKPIGSFVGSTESGSPTASFGPDLKKLKESARRLMVMSVDDCASSTSTSPLGRAIRVREKSMSFASPLSAFSGKEMQNYHVETYSSKCSPEISTMGSIYSTPMSVIASGRNISPTIDIMKFHSTTDHHVAAADILNEFLKIELGDLYQPDKLFANLNLFQLRQSRRNKDFEFRLDQHNSEISKLKIYIKQLNLTHHNELVNKDIKYQKLSDAVKDLQRSTITGATDCILPF